MYRKLFFEILCNEESAQTFLTKLVCGQYFRKRTSPIFWQPRNIKLIVKRAQMRASPPQATLIKHWIDINSSTFDNKLQY